MAALGWLLNMDFGGTIAGTGYLNTSGVLTVTNITETKSLNVVTASFNDLVASISNSNSTQTIPKKKWTPKFLGSRSRTWAR